MGLGGRRYVRGGGDVGGGGGHGDDGLQQRSNETLVGATIFRALLFGRMEWKTEGKSHSVCFIEGRGGGGKKELLWHHIMVLVVLAGRRRHTPQVVAKEEEEEEERLGCVFSVSVSRRTEEEARALTAQQVAGADEARGGEEKIDGRRRNGFGAERRRREFRR